MAMKQFKAILHCSNDGNCWWPASSFCDNMVFTMRRIVCLSVRPSQADTLSKWLN